jgi:hypothetical protein
MILTDTGPIVALLDKNDVNHDICVTATKLLPPVPMLTTWPCFTEAMYLLGSVGGYYFQTELWRLLFANRLTFHSFSSPEIQRMDVLMQKYQDTPMDLADASIIVVAEIRSFHQVFTLDSDFYHYRLIDGSALEVIP